MIKKFFNNLNIAQITNLNNEERFLFHKKVLENKKMLKSCYSDFYEKIINIEKKFRKKKIKTFV